MRSSHGHAAYGALLVSTLALLAAAAGRAELSAAQRGALLESGCVGDAVVLALEKASRLRVMVAFSAPA